MRKTLQSFRHESRKRSPKKMSSMFDYTNSKWYKAFDNEDGDGTGDGLDSDDWVILN